jgi:hypothetical protein
MGTNIFIGHMPPEPDDCICIFPTPAIYDPNNILHPYDKPTFQIMARGDFDTAYTMLRNSYDVLQGFGGEELSGIYFVEVVALSTDVNSLGKDGMNRMQLTQNYRALVYAPTEHRI